MPFLCTHPDVDAMVKERNAIDQSLTFLFNNQLVPRDATMTFDSTSFTDAITASAQPFDCKAISTTNNNHMWMLAKAFAVAFTCCTKLATTIKDDYDAPNAEASQQKILKSLEENKLLTNQIANLTMAFMDVLNEIRVENKLEAIKTPLRSNEWPPKNLNAVIRSQNSIKEKALACRGGLVVSWYGMRKPGKDDGHGYSTAGVRSNIEGGDTPVKKKKSNPSKNDTRMFLHHMLLSTPFVHYDLSRVVCTTLAKQYYELMTFDDDNIVFNNVNPSFSEHFNSVVSELEDRNELETIVD